MFSPDGKYLAGRNSKSLKIWDLEQGTLLKTLTGHTMEVISLAWSPDGQYLVSGSQDRTIKFWDLAKILVATPNHSPLPVSNPYSSSTNFAIEILPEMSQKIHMILAVPKDQTAEVRSLAFSPQDQHLAVGGWHNRIKLWTVTETHPMMSLGEKSHQISTVAWSPNGQYLVCGGTDTLIQVWDLGNNARASILGHEESQVVCLAFSPDGRYLASGSRDKSIKVWEMEYKILFKTLYHWHRVQRRGISILAWSPNSKYLAFTENPYDIHMWNIIDGTHVKLDNTSQANELSFSRDGQYLACGSSDKTVRIWNLSLSIVTNFFTGYQGGVAFSSQGQILAFGTIENKIEIWDLDREILVNTLTGHVDCVHTVIFDPSGRYAASASKDHTIKIWDWATGKITKKFADHGGSVENVDWSPDSQYLVSGGSDAYLKIWAVSDGKILKTLIAHHCIRSLAFSYNGQHLASGSSDTNIVLWDMLTKKTVVVLRSHSQGVNSLAFSPDGQYLVSGSSDQTVKIWNPTTGTLITTLKDHDRKVTTVACSPNGQYVVSGSTDHQIRIWNLANPSIVTLLTGHTSPATSSVNIKVIILCARFEEALQACKTLEYYQLPVVRKLEGRILYYSVSFTDTDQHPFQLEIYSCTDQAGSITTSAITTRLLHHRRPHWLFMTGICAGHPNKASLGDLIIADRAVELRAGKVILSGQVQHGGRVPAINQLLRDPIQDISQKLKTRWSGLVPTPRPRTQRYKKEVLLHILYQYRQSQERPPNATTPAPGDLWGLPLQDIQTRLETDIWVEGESASLLNKLNHQDPSEVSYCETSCRYYLNDLQFHQIRNRIGRGNYPEKDPIEPRVHLGVMASDSVVRADMSASDWNTMATELAQRDLIGLEMEASGLYEAMRIYNDQNSDRVQGILVKGISDLASPEKDDQYHEYGKQIAVVFVYQFLMEYGYQLAFKENDESEDLEDA